MFGKGLREYAKQNLIIVIFEVFCPVSESVRERERESVCVCVCVVSRLGSFPL